MALAWCYRPFKRLLPPGHPFFEEGNIYCNILRKKVNLSEDFEEIIQSSEPEFECTVHCCHESFTSVVRESPQFVKHQTVEGILTVDYYLVSVISRYEAHYRSCHWNRCRFCRKSFQTNFLLDLHILENHDTLFKMIARKKHMYRCLVESCPDRFSGEEDRKKHLVELHRYPADFRFSRPSRLQRKLKRKEADSDGTIYGDSAQMCSTELPMDTGIMTTHHQVHHLQTNHVLGKDGKTTSGENDKSTHKQRLPRAICFGRGSSRGFRRGTIPKGHGQGQNKKNKGTTKPPIPSTDAAMEDVS